LVTAGGHQLIHRPIVVGGAPLQLHAEKALRFESDPKDKFGVYGNGKSLKEELLSDQWQYVTIQQASIKSHNIETYQPYAGQLRDYIKKYAPQAELLMHQTWAYRIDDSRFSKGKETAEGEPATQEAMYQMLTNSYETIAGDLGIRMIPVGDAFHLVDNDPKWSFKKDEAYDFKTPLHTSLPNQKNSLHVGWRKGKEQDGKFTLTMDGHHANSAGQYLGACVFYEVLFGESAVGNSFVAPEIDKEYGRFLQEAAHRAVEQRKAAAKK
jgi:hypothetical protein